MEASIDLIAEFTVEDKTLYAKLISPIMEDPLIDESVKEPFMIKTETDDLGDTYTGQFYKGLRHGHGKIVYRKGVDARDLEGQFKNGFAVYGVETYKGGDSYQGEFKNGVRFGKGIYTWNNGDIYEGQWADGHMNGHGTDKWQDGRIYTG